MGTAWTVGLRLAAGAAVLTLAAACSTGPEPTAVEPATLDSPATAPSPTPAPATPDGPSPSPPAENALPEPDDPPAQWVGITDDHRLVVVDTASGEEVVVLGDFDDPDDFGGEGQEPFAGGQFVTAAAVSPDGFTVYYETCCEPAPGIVWRIPIEGGESDRIFEGAWPAVSRAGDRLALVTLQWLTIVELPGGETTALESPSEDLPMWLGQPTWSPDGAVIVFSRRDELEAPGELARLDLDTATTSEDAELLVDTAGLGLATFAADGDVHAVEQRWDPGEPDPIGPARGVVIDLETGQRRDTVEYPEAVRSHAHGASGAFLLVTLVDGSVAWQRADGEREVLGRGFIAAAW